MPTAAFSPPMSEVLNASNEALLVWPFLGGAIRGQSIIPIHAKLPEQARNDQSLYRLAAAFDSIRVGAARERGLARDYIATEIPALMLKRHYE